MSLKRHFFVALLAGIAYGPAVASAQFVEPAADDSSGDVASESSEESAKTTDLDLRLTLSSFVYRESGRDAPPLAEDAVTTDNASDFQRYFGDARLQLYLDDIAGKRVQARFDARARKTSKNRVQSGFAPGDEYDLREALIRYRGDKSELTVGRQTISEAAASKVDGISYRRTTSETWSVSTFAGTFPQRGSRSLTTDYPRAQPPMVDEPGARIVPATLGAGAGYRKPRLYGDFGLAGVIPLRKDALTDVREQPRIFASSAGYWTPSAKLNIYHYGLFELSSPSGASASNLSLELNSYPHERLQLRLGMHHMDNEFLEATAKNQLEDPDVGAMGVVQNSITLRRVSSDAVRAGASVNFARRRFEVTAMATARQRPEFSVPLSNGNEFVFPTTRAVEGSLTLLDRRSLFGLRASAQLIVLRGLGREVPTSSDGAIARMALGKTFAQGRGEWEIDGAAQRLRDAQSGMQCSFPDPLSCFGSSKVDAGQAGALISYRARGGWQVILDGHGGVQKVETVDALGEPAPLPLILSGSVFARLGWRFH